LPEDESSSSGSGADALAFRVPGPLDGRRLDEVLASEVPTRTRAYHQKLVRRGRVSVDGRRVVRSNLRVSAGQRVELKGLEARREPPASVALSFLHVDADIAVVDKPAGIVTHPNDKISSGTLCDLAAAALGRLPVALGHHRPGVVHRLDRETSGVLVLGRTEEAMLDLQAQFRARSVEKYYLALAHGVPEADELHLTGALAPVEAGQDRQQVTSARGAKPAETRVRVRERYGAHALLDCHPRTGRRHQIRVHLADAGHPLVDDRLYEPEELRAPRGTAPWPGRHALHAHVLALSHPRTGERLRFEAPLAPDLEELRRWLARGG